MTPISNARAASDTRHRIAVANSQPRRIKLIGLGRGGAIAVGAHGLARLREVQVLDAADGVDASRLAGAEMIFMVASSGDWVGAAMEIKRLARAANILVTAILIDQGDTHAELPLLRAASDMLIVVSDAGYVVDMLVQLGA